MNENRTPKSTDDLLTVQDLSVEFSTDHGFVQVVSGASFSVPKGRIVGLVGESGSGKSVTCQSILGLVPSPPGRIGGGRILFEGRDLLTLNERQLRGVRGRQIGMIFQEPMTSLNPAFTVGQQIEEVLRKHLRMTRADARRRAGALLDRVGIPNAAERLRQYPHEFSGGMRQRVMIAIALAGEPKLLIADEPTTALDVTIQAQVLELVRELTRELAMSVLIVTHDLGVVADLCDEVVIMYAGQVVERADVMSVFSRPMHPYTEALLRSRPSVDAKGHLTAIPGFPPAAHELPEGCRFGPRCGYRASICDADPALVEVGTRRSTRCARRGELSLEGTE